MIRIVDPVASRSWETLAASTAAGDLACLLAQCAREAPGVWAVLKSHGLADARAHVDLAARDAASGDVVLRKRRLRVDLPAVEFERTLTLHHVLSELENQDIAYVTVDLSLPGSVLRGSRRCSVEQLFVITVDMWPSGAATTTLHTFSDCWLSHDLRGHKQPDVQKQNAALLRAALGAVTEQLGTPDRALGSGCSWCAHGVRVRGLPGR